MSDARENPLKKQLRVLPGQRKMKWIKKGLIYGPDGSSAWAKHSALAPTPIFINESTIRVFACFRDNRGISRIGFVDVDPETPSRIIAVSKNPVLDIGLPGNFDDNGVILGDVIWRNDELWMYYIGFQKVEKVKFLAFTGLAISSDGGNSFQRYQNTPVMDRNHTDYCIRAIHSVMFEKGIWKVWYASGYSWKMLKSIPYPIYDIKYTESSDGKQFEEKSIDCITYRGDEYRIGRPRVYREADRYFMYFTFGSTTGKYLAGYAESEDGKVWQRMDEKIGIEPSGVDWESRSICYPCMIRHKNRKYIFYNGNDNGMNGFGYAELTV